MIGSCIIFSYISFTDIFMHTGPAACMGGPLMLRSRAKAARARRRPTSSLLRGWIGPFEPGCGAKHSPAAFPTLEQLPSACPPPPCKIRHTEGACTHRGMCCSRTEDLEGRTCPDKSINVSTTQFSCCTIEIFRYGKSQSIKAVKLFGSRHLAEEVRHRGECVPAEGGVRNSRHRAKL